MGQVSRCMRRGERELVFWCPGCKTTHSISVGSGGWEWNGSVDAPTFRPSVLVRSGHHGPGHTSEHCWCTHNAALIARGSPASSFNCLHCHSFVTDGQIQFLSDCVHPLAGQTVPLPELPPELRD